MVVVGVGEVVELGLEIGDVGGWWLGGEPAFEGLSACHISLGRSAANLTWDDFGRFLGSGVTRPAATRRRRMVDVDTSML